MLPISKLSITLYNVSYYIMHSGTCDFSESTLCKLQLFFCSVSLARAGFKMHVRFAMTLGTHSLGGGVAHMSQTGSLAAEFYMLIQKALRSQFQSLCTATGASECALCFHFSIPDSSFALQSAVRHLV